MKWMPSPCDPAKPVLGSGCHLRASGKAVMVTPSAAAAACSWALEHGEDMLGTPPGSEQVMIWVQTSEPAARHVTPLQRK